MAEYSHLSEPDPEFLAALAKLPPVPPVIQFDVHQLRAMDVSVRPSQPAPETAYRVEDRQLKVDDSEITLRLLTPTSDFSTGKTFPILLWVHGGGWTIGNIDDDDHILRAICVNNQIAIVNVDYRLAPEHKFPTGLNDCYAALKWTAENQSLISGSISKGFLVGGTSAGGNIATILAHRSKDDPYFEGRTLTGQILQIPVIVEPKAVPNRYKSQLLSYEQNQDAPVLSRKLMEAFYEWLGGDSCDPEISPLLYPSHKGLPPAYIQICGLDPLRDEGLLYEKVLKEDGVPTRLDIYPGVAHAFNIQGCTPNIKAASKLYQDFGDGVNWLLSFAGSS